MAAEDLTLLPTSEKANMRVLSTKAHGYLDYAMGLLLIVLPWLLGFAAGGAETWVTVAAGVAVIGYSLFTDYELGLIRRSIQMPVHLWIDAALGLVLAVSPWLFAFDQRIWLPQLVLGVLEMGAALLSDTIPGYDRRGGARADAA